MLYIYMSYVVQTYNVLLFVFRSQNVHSRRHKTVITRKIEMTVVVSIFLEIGQVI